MREVIMGYQGEMSLKGLNRNQFESTMMKILRYRLKTVGKFRVYCTQSTFYICLLYTSDAADEEDSVDLGGRRIIKKKNNQKEKKQRDDETRKKLYN